MPDLEEIDFLEIVEIEEEEFIQHFEEVQEKWKKTFLCYGRRNSEEEFVEVIEELFNEEEAERGRGIRRSH